MPTPDTLDCHLNVGKWDSEAIELLKKAVALLERLDKKLGDKECADPDKMKWVKELEDVLERKRQAESGASCAVAAITLAG